MNNDLMSTKTYNSAKPVEAPLRKTLQYLMPVKIDKPVALNGAYNIYPFCSLEEKKIFNGFDSLARWIIEQRTVVIDGYVGVFWDKVQAALHNYFIIAGLSVKWIRTEQFLKSPSVIE